MRTEPMLWLSDARGVYIPRDFANCFTNREENVKGVTSEQWAVLEAGPDHEHYWDVWTEVLDGAKVTDGKVTCFLYQDGDLWLIPEGMEWNEYDLCYQWPNDSEEG